MDAALGRRLFAEFLGTALLVIFAVGTATLSFGFKLTGSSVSAGVVTTALAFGLVLVALAYTLGPISGCHVNPAVSFGVYVAGRMSVADMLSYWVAQVLGAIVGAVVLYLILSGKAQGWNGGLGQNGWGAGYLGEYNTLSAFVFEAVATFLFLVTILGVTQKGSPSMLAGLAIGLTLTAIHLAGIPVSGSSVNPARSLGPALFGGATALSQLWLYIVAPCIGAALAGLLFRDGAPLDANTKM